jgi:hypothetical protein
MQPDYSINRCLYSGRTSVQYARLGSVISIFAQGSGPVAQRTATIAAATKDKKQRVKAKKAEGKGIRKRLPEREERGREAATKETLYSI